LSPEFDRSDALARFHRALVDEIARNRPAYLREPFTVAEIYQNLVPYRTHRDRIGVEMNGDYEDALLRLLAGEGEFLLLESEHARNEITEELSSPNPNTGLYREFAAVDVRLNPMRLPRDLPDPEGAAPPLPFVPPDIDCGAHGQPVPPRATAPAATRAAAPAPTPPVPAAVPAPTAHEAPSGCPWCREALPRRANLNYCPFCGADLQTAPCPTCGGEIDSGWRFCAGCGTPVGDGG
jgi:hypothetical protein